LKESPNKLNFKGRESRSIAEGEDGTLGKESATQARKSPNAKRETLLLRRLDFSKGKEKRWSKKPEKEGLTRRLDFGRDLQHLEKAGPGRRGRSRP